MSQKNQQVAGCGCLAACHTDHHRRYRQRLLLIEYIDEPTSVTNLHPAASSPSFGAAATPSPTHTRHHRAAVTHPPCTLAAAQSPPPSVPPSKAAPAPRSTCHPLTNSGKCYQPGELP